MVLPEPSLLCTVLFINMYEWGLIIILPEIVPAGGGGEGQGRFDRLI